MKQRELFDTDLVIKLGLSIIFPIFAFVNAYTTMNVYKWENIEDLFVLIYGGFDIPIMINNPIALFHWLTPIIYIIYISGDYIINNIKSNGPYIFTRTNSRSTWFLIKMFKMSQLIFVYVFFQNLILFVLGFISKYSIHNSSFVIIIKQFLLYYLLVLLIILITNVINFFFKSTITFLLVIIGSMSSLFLASGIITYYPFNHFILEKVLALIPISHSFLLLYDIELDSNIQNFMFETNFNITHSVIYLLSLIVLGALFGMYKIKNMDII